MSQLHKVQLATIVFLYRDTMRVVKYFEAGKETIGLARSNCNLLLDFLLTSLHDVHCLGNMAVHGTVDVILPSF